MLLRWFQQLGVITTLLFLFSPVSQQSQFGIPYFYLPEDYLQGPIAYNISGHYLTSGLTLPISGGYYVNPIENDTSVGIEIAGYQSWWNFEDENGGKSVGDYSVSWFNGTYNSWQLGSGICSLQTMGVNCTGWNSTYYGDPTGEDTYVNRCQMQFNSRFVSNFTTIFTVNGAQPLDYTAITYFPTGQNITLKVTFGDALPSQTFPTIPCSNHTMTH